MDVEIRRDADIFLYDAQLDGYSDGDIFATVSGTPAISSNNLRLTSAEIVSVRAFRNMNVEMYMNIPTAPTAGDDRQFGMKNLNDGNIGRMEFDITGAVFTANVYDREGVIIESKVINWDTDWTAEDVRYRISFSERLVLFTVDDTIVARYESGIDHEITADTELSKRPLCIHITNGNADNINILTVNAV